MTTSDLHDDHVSASALTARGWTRAAIRIFLGEPDRTAPNPFYRQAAPMRLYSLARAVTAEDTEQWRQWRTHADQRSARAKAAADRKHDTSLAAAERQRDALIAEVTALPITVAVLDLDRLAKLAVAHPNRTNADWADDRRLLPTPANVAGVDTATLHRWMVNYLRHERTAYDTTLTDLCGRLGQDAAADLLRDRVLEAIAQTYPTLAAEARRQITQL